MLQSLAKIADGVLGRLERLDRKILARHEGLDVHPWPGADPDYDKKVAAMRERYRQRR